MNIVDLQNFYSQDLGKITTKLILRDICKKWINLTGYSVLGIGYTIPYLDYFKDKCLIAFALMPSSQGVIYWPYNHKNCVALTDENNFPLADSLVDRILIVHGLEMTNKPQDYLREIWRILKPNGRVIFVVPNRSGIWTRTDKTPFGYGSPFSQKQMILLLKANMFQPINWSCALYIPPTTNDFILKFAMIFEKFGLCIRAKLGGVTIIEASKQVYALLPTQLEYKKKLKYIIVS